jgi:serine/threonine protein kinase
MYALKVMSKAKIIAKKSVRAVLLERIILSKLMEGGNEGVVSMLASFQDDSHLYILMDYLEGQSLRSHLNSGISPAPHQISIPSLT